MACVHLITWPMAQRAATFAVAGASHPTMPSSNPPSDSGHGDSPGSRSTFRRAAGRSFGKWVGIGVSVCLVLGVGLPTLGRFLHLGGAFRNETIDRSSPAVVQAIAKLSSYHAATGVFDVIVDVEKKTRWIPSALRGERSTLLAHGQVDASVDFSHVGRELGADGKGYGVKISDQSVAISLPSARLEAPVLDVRHSRIVAHKRGMFDRIGSALGGAPSDAPMYQLAERKLARAAATTGLTRLAEGNTRQMLKGLLAPLGYTEVTVTFIAPVERDVATDVVARPEAIAPVRPSAKAGAVRSPRRSMVSQRNGIGVGPGVLEAVPLQIG